MIITLLKINDPTISSSLGYRHSPTARDIVPEVFLTLSKVLYTGVLQRMKIGVELIGAFLKQAPTVLRTPLKRL